MLERFTDSALRVVALSREEAHHLAHHLVEPEHLLLGLLREERGQAALALASLGITADSAREQVEDIRGLGDEPSSGLPPLSPRSKRVLRLSGLEMLPLGAHQVDTQHLLFALTRDDDGVVARVLGGLGTSCAGVRARMLSGSAGSPERPLGRSHVATMVRPVVMTRRTARWQRRYVRLCVVADAMAALLAGSVAYVVHFERQTPAYVAITPLLPVVWVLMLAVTGAYRTDLRGDGLTQFRRVLTTGGGLPWLVALVVLLSHIPVSRAYILTSLALTTVLTVGERWALRMRLNRRRTAGECMYRVVVVGHEMAALAMSDRLRAEPQHGLQIVAACLPVPGQLPSLMRRGIPVVGDLGSDLGREDVRRMALDLEPTGARLFLEVPWRVVKGPRLLTRPVTGLPLVEVRRPSRDATPDPQRGDAAA